MQQFDPYYIWLGIPPKDQPPHHYRLLGLELFEDEPKVIGIAADRQMAHVRTFQRGEHSAQSQQLLNEIAGARVCLLNPEKKAAYDLQLREQLRPKKSSVENGTGPITATATRVPAPVPPPAPTPPTSPLPTANDPLAMDPLAMPMSWPRIRNKIRWWLRRVPHPVWIAGGIVMGLMLLAVMVAELVPDGPARDTTSSSLPPEMKPASDEPDAPPVPTEPDGPEPSDADKTALPSYLRRPAIRPSSSAATALPSRSPSAANSPTSVALPPKLFWTVTPDPAPQPEFPLEGDAWVCKLSPETVKVSHRLLFPRHASPYVLCYHLADDPKNRRCTIVDLRNGRTVSQSDIGPWTSQRYELGPDGRYLAGFMRGNAEPLWIWSLDSGKATQSRGLSNVRVQADVDFCFADRNRIVAAVPTGHQLRLAVVDLRQNGLVTDLAELDNRQQVYLAKSLAASPGGRYVALVRGNFVEVYKLANGQLAGRLRISQDDAPATIACQELSFSPDGTLLAGLTTDSYNANTTRLVGWNVAGGRMACDRRVGDLHTARRFESWENTYPGWKIDWVPDSGHVMLNGAIVIDARTSNLIAELPLDATAHARRFISSDHLATICRDPATGRPLLAALRAEDNRFEFPSTAVAQSQPQESPDASPPTVSRIRSSPTISPPASPAPISAAETNRQGYPIPNQQEQARALTAIRKLYAKEFARATRPESKLVLAQTLLEFSKAADIDTTTRYVMLTEALEKAVESGEPKTALEALDQLVASYQVDDWQLRCDALSQLSRSARMPLDRQMLVQQLFSTGEAALAENRYDVADEMATAAVWLGAQLENTTIRDHARNCRDQIRVIQKAWENSKAAFVVLQQNPEDPNANLTAGKFLCFAKNDWEQGLKHLAKGTDRILARLAEQDIHCNKTGGACALALGDGWWQEGSARTGNERTALRARGKYWYLKCTSYPAEFDRARAQQRLAEP